MIFSTIDGFLASPITPSRALRRASLNATNYSSFNDSSSSQGSQNDNHKNLLDSRITSPKSLQADQSYWHFQLAIPTNPSDAIYNQQQHQRPLITICHCRIPCQKDVQQRSDLLIEKLLEMPVGTPIVCTGLLQLNGWARKDGKGGCNWQCKVLDVRPNNVETII